MHTGGTTQAASVAGSAAARVPVKVFVVDPSEKVWPLAAVAVTE
jgi:hypothetical protein